LSAYYFLVSSLPALEKGKPAPISYEEFLSSAQDQLSEADYAVLEQSSLNPGAESSDALLKTWFDWEYEFRTYMTQARVSRLGFSVDVPYTSGNYVENFSRIQSILGSGNPLEVEEKLDGMRWDFLNDLEKDEFFSFINVQVYALKLLIALRQGKFTLEQGKELFERDYQNIIEQEQLGN
jgi:hypothetical protein